MNHGYQPQAQRGFNNYNNRNFERTFDEEPKKLQTRRTVDYGSGMVQWLQKRRLGTPMPVMRDDPNYILDMLPPVVDIGNPAASLCCKYIHTSSNKNKHPVNAVKWTPDGRRLLTASSSGEFTLWNGLTFNFETILQAHETAVRALEWSPSGDWLLSGDHEGLIKYSQPNMNIVKVLPAHTEAIRDLAFSPASNKFVTASDDGSMKLWNFNEGIEERTFTGHGWDVKTVDWHQSKGLIVSGSKDNLVKLWDPRTAKCLSTLHGHKNTVSKVMFQKCGGSLLATCSRDSSARIVDLRMMKDLRVLRGHEKDVTTLTWHPVVPSLLTTGGHDGVVNHYLLNESATNLTNSVSTSATLAQPTLKIPFAHESAIWSMEYHPLGHLLATGSNDRATRFWARPRPGDESTFLDRYHVGDDSKEQLFNNNNRKRGVRDEAMEDGVVDQQAPVPSQMQLPGIGGQVPSLAVQPPPFSSGIPGFGGGGSSSVGGFPPPPPPLLPNQGPHPAASHGVPLPWQVPGLFGPGLNGSAPPPPPTTFQHGANVPGLHDGMNPDRLRFLQGR
ncbi:Polyadenylation factor subunit 2 [Taphrina deformans PYCC 5710]|uniref:Polyadenylation factor subunit 2 n=1 Tax=Taphrina deformans (strain PYCC 5710 / ATCC 11124 / CBS 356.35 / IMI 108563 / JCM 9778 / NBRC 8474) TaxID=1097556 RepID=R4XDH8_TAPDE|nr:Polyadenylation factor subunit 2 [Taphrina deformans PYCC 5710]|eukprot:CCG81404.1 Polyadenylation factor subunit 2 [Taphrina deformans PYCC 5710]